MRSSNQNDITAFIGQKGSGKTTLATYEMLFRNEPVIIIDTIRQFGELDYRYIANSLSELRFYLFNPTYSKVIRRGNFQVSFRPKFSDLKKEIDEAIKMLFDFKNCSIYFEEIELYTDQYINNKSPLFSLFSLSRNRGHNLIITAKTLTTFKNNLREAIDYFYLSNHSTDELIKFVLKQFTKGDKARIEGIIRGLKDKEFLKISRGKNLGIFKINKQTANKLK